MPILADGRLRLEVIALPAEVDEAVPEVAEVVEVGEEVVCLH
jgi:hypothetical protein